MKTLKFSKNLIPPILSGKKTITWRLFDDKNLQAGNKMIFLDSENKKPFAKALLIKVREKSFKKLTEKDKEEHEEFKNDEEMYKTYSEYYKTKVTPDALLKVIKFKILEKI